MTIDTVRRKYSMSIDDVLNVRALYSSTVTIRKVAENSLFKRNTNVEVLNAIT